MHPSWHVGCFPEKVWIVRRLDSSLPEGAEVLSALEATWRLDAWFTDDAWGRLLLIDICEALGHPVAVGVGLHPSRLRARLREAFADGSLHAYRVRRVSAGAPLVTRPESSRGEGPEPPAKGDKGWIAIQLMDDGAPPKPVPFMKYRIELPDQSVREGLLDQNGQALLQGIDPGTCKVSFPQLHGDDWRPVA
ncbi:hypothetical protein [Sorangium sp. So ce381]|uniref:hypothetical protein n=1 Tax=Sorangium sp. So ce381 TaxID=3133307 RepID=UPI003F5C5B0D